MTAQNQVTWQNIDKSFNEDQQRKQGEYHAFGPFCTYGSGDHKSVGILEYYKRFFGNPVSRKDTILFLITDSNENKRPIPGTDWTTSSTKGNASEVDELLVQTTAEKLSEIQNIFGLSISHLAKILRSSRPSVYAWIGGEAPRDNIVDRIEILHQISKRWEKINPYHYSPGRLMRQPLGNQPSMLEYLTKETINTEKIEKALKILLELVQRQRVQMDSIKLRSEKTISYEMGEKSTRRRLSRIVASSDDN